MGSSIELSDLVRDYDMDLLGNLTPTAGGFKQNGTTATFSHTVNATNEITTLARANPAGQATIASDDFASTMSPIWTTKSGSWSVGSGKLSSTGLGLWNSPAQLTGGAVVGDSSMDVLVTLPIQDVPAGTKSGGPIFAWDPGSGIKYAVVISAGSPGSVGIAKGSAGFWASEQSSSVTISTGTQYRVEVEKIQRHVRYRVWNGTTLVHANTYDSTADLKDGLFGFYAGSKSVNFDDLSVTRLDQVNAAAPRWASTAKTSITSNKMQVESDEWGGEARLEWAGDDAYIAQADIDLNGGDDAELKFRYADPDNYYAVRLGEDSGGGSGPVELLSVVRGKEAVVASSTYTTASSVTLKVRVDANDDVEVWVDGSSKIVNSNGLDVAAGNVALAGEKAIFDNVRVGYDTGADDVIDDYVVNETFGNTNITPTYDDNGNLTFDGNFRYIYDAWNRLVKATLDDTDVTIHEAAFDGLGRRVMKTYSAYQEYKFIDPAHPGRLLIGRKSFC